MLIPKIKNPQSFDKFRPISLCNVIYKILSKLLVNKMSMVLKNLISPEQGAFVKGRNILENITLTQEMVKLLQRKTRGGDVMVKIDMSKAYDRVDWRFLDHTLRTLGFLEFFCRLIKNCVTLPWFSIMMHGTYKGYFKAKRVSDRETHYPRTFLLSWKRYSQDWSRGRWRRRGFCLFPSRVGLLSLHTYYMLTI